jgi:hypothetical protein
MESIPVGPRGDIAYDVEEEELPLGRLLAVVTLIGQHNISLDPVRFLLQFNKDGNAFMKHLTKDDEDEP